MIGSIILTSLTPEDLKQIIREVLLENNSVPEPKSELKYLTRQEACKCLRISLPTLYEYVKSGVIIGHRIGRRVLFKQTDIENAIKEIPRLKYSRGRKS